MFDLKEVYIYKFPESVETHRSREKIDDFQGLRDKENGKMWVKVYKVSVMQDEVL
jgi:hypothetical protein